MDVQAIENIEAEQAVLGSLLIQGDLIKDTVLYADQFSLTKHKLIFRAMREVDDANIPVDFVSIVTQLGDLIDQVGGVTYLSDLAESVPTTANFKSYEQMISDVHRVRKARMLGSQLAMVTSEDEVPAILQELGNLQGDIKGQKRTTAAILSEIFEDMSTPKEGMSGIDTGLTDLNAMTGGWQGGDLIIVAARPSMGKTAFALKLAMRNCHQGGVSDIFSLEMSDKQLAQRMLSNIAHVNGLKWMNPFSEFTQDDHKKMAMAIGMYEKFNMNIHDKPGQTVYDIRSAVRQSMKEHPDQQHLVVVDYLQLITPVGKFERHDLAVGHISKEMKNLAREFNIPVILLSQLSRGVEQRQDKRPMMSDIRDSGNVEQDADIIAFLYRDDYYDKNSENKNITEIILAKHRNGPTGTVQSAFIKEYGRFVNLERRMLDER